MAALTRVMALQEQQTVYLDPAVHSLQRAASSFQTLGQVAGEAAGRAVGITPARMHAAAAQLQQNAHGAAAQLQQDVHGAAVDGTKEVIRTIGIDSNTPGFGTPDSYYGEPPLAPAHIMGCCTCTAMHHHVCLKCQLQYLTSPPKISLEKLWKAVYYTQGRSGS